MSEYNTSAHHPPLRPNALADEIAAHGGVSTDDVLDALETAATADTGFGQTLVRQKLISEVELLNVFSAHYQMRLIRQIDDEALDPELVDEVSIAYLRKNLFVPFCNGGDTLYVAVYDPSDTQIRQDIRLLFGDNAVPVLCPEEQIISAINRTYGQNETEADSIVEELDMNEDSALFAELEDAAASDLLDDTSDAPIIKLVNHILSKAVKTGASDIHIEPYQGNLVVRFRLDGVLHNILTLSRRLHAAVISRIKIMARLNIAEKRLPQDGRIEIKIGDRAVDLRVSCLPTGFGERVVMRLLEKNAKILNLTDLGLADTDFSNLKKMLGLSHGILLVTGPTGSGKTTTLYAALSHINSPDKNILTIEDPIEYQIEGIGQMQVNAKIGLNFSRGLRAMVRQDPDIILIGEIRDGETAEIAVQAALTGHLVFSTLHTNDAPSAVTRLIDMGVDPFLISSAVRAIVAQRLVRVLCPECKKQVHLSRQELLDMGVPELDGTQPVYVKVGCPKCMETGYKGRTAIYEFLRMTPSLQDMVLKTSDANQIRTLAVKDCDMQTLRQDGIRKVLEGVTTLEEVLRVAYI